MATVHFGRLLGPVGFSRTVAIKRLHPQFAKDPEFVSMFLDEARLAARIQHPNVVATLDVVAMEGELFLVMEYVAGESLSKLVKAARKVEKRIPPRVVAAIMVGMLHGLHAAHVAKSERGEALDIVHRDISPQNVLVGTDGSARVLDFGVAKAAARAQSTKDGQMKGKMSYMAPEQLGGDEVDRRADIFASGVVLWEALTGQRLFSGSDAGEVFGKVLRGDIDPPSKVVPTLPKTLDKVMAKALERDVSKRYSTAREFAIALEKAAPIASPREVGEWVEKFGGEALAKRASRVAVIESESSSIDLQDGVKSVQDTATGLTPPPASAVSAVSAVSAGTAPPGSDAGPPSVPSEVSTASSPSEVSTASQPSEVSQTSQLTPSQVTPSQVTPSQVTSPSQMSQVSFATQTSPRSRPDRQSKKKGVVVVAFAAMGAVGIGFGAMALATSGASETPVSPAALAPAEGDPTPAPAEEEEEETEELAEAPYEDPTLGAVSFEDLEAVVDAGPAKATPAARLEPGKPSLADRLAKANNPGKSPDPKPAEKKPSKKKPEKKKSGNCDIPFFIDAKGIKRPKPDCL